MFLMFKIIILPLPTYDYRLQCAWASLLVYVELAIARVIGSPNLGHGQIFVLRGYVLVNMI